MNNNKKYLKNIKKNWVLLVPQGWLFLLQMLILVVGFNALLEVAQSVQDSSTKVLAIIVITFALLKLITMIGLESMNEYGKTWVKVMTDNVWPI